MAQSPPPSTSLLGSPLQASPSPSAVQRSPTTTNQATASSSPLNNLLQVSPTLLYLSLHFPSDSFSHDPQPSAHLATVMSSHRPDCAAVIAQMVSRMADRLAPLGEHTRTQALRLYYGILENMIVIETTRLTRQFQREQHQQILQQQQQLPSSSASQTSAAPSITSTSTATPGPFRFDIWLFSRVFHASLVAISFETVFFAHNLTPKLFPFVLETLDLSAWDFVRHLELCVRALPTTIITNGSTQAPPGALKQYLKRLENDCLSWWVWKKDSPLLKILKEQEMKAKAEEEEKSRAVPMETETKNEEEKKSDSDASTATSTQATIQPIQSTQPISAVPIIGMSVGLGYLSQQQSKQFELFSRQLFTLAAEHLSWLCSPSALSISNLHMEACWELLLEILTCHTHLLYERHLDTIILCVLYNILCKIAIPASPTATLVGQVTPPPLDFKRIIAVYTSRWEQNQTKVIKDISSWGAAPANSPPSTDSTPKPDHMNIIAFYNRYFIHAIKIYSLEHIKPKLQAALDAQALLRNGGVPLPQKQPIRSASSPSSLTVPPPPPPAQILTQFPVTGSPTPSSQLPFAPSNPPKAGDDVPSASTGTPGPTPRTSGRNLPHRTHPYSVTASSHLSVPAGAVTPGYPNHGHGPASIHAFLSPRKLHIPSTNIYLSRLAAPPPNTTSAAVPQSVAARVGLGVTALTATGANASAAPTARVSYTPTKSKLGGVDEQQPQITLTTYPNSPTPHAPYAYVNTPGNGSVASLGSIGSVPLTPMSRSLYAFGESPRKSLDEINQRMNGPHLTSLQQASSSPQRQAGYQTTQAPGSAGRRRQLFAQS